MGQWLIAMGLVLLCAVGAAAHGGGASSGGGGEASGGGAPSGGGTSGDGGAASGGGSDGGAMDWARRVGAGGRAESGPCHLSLNGTCLVRGLTRAQGHTLDAFAACQRSGVVLGHVFEDGRYRYSGPFATLPGFRACMDRWEP